MGLSFVNPSGFKFFIISNAIALIILSMMKSIADIILPNINVFLFSVINGIYTVLAIGNWQLAFYCLLFIGSLYIGHRTIDYRFIPKK